ncbi:MBL fold metallo-hydrolase [Candidatus Gottesmanbacteria bacterium]|nr:MBL fold metallo-hydrolase [Candidatus Gottesmanbacteria bacterium]
MDITYLGHSSFRLRGKAATVVTDPFDSSAVGLKFPKHITADIVTISHDQRDHSATQELEGEFYIVDGPGEYEVKGVGIVGFSVDKNTMYRIEIDGISVVHLGDIGHVLTSAQVDSLNGVDILMIPVGGVSTVDAAAASQIIHEVEPSIVIPMHYGRPELNQKILGDLAQVEAFLKEMGKESVLPQPKLVVTKEKIPEEMQIVVLE